DSTGKRGFLRDAPGRIGDWEKQEGNERDQVWRISGERIVDDGSHEIGRAIGIDRDRQPDHGPVDVEAPFPGGNQREGGEGSAIEHKTDQRSQNRWKKEAKDGEVDIHPRGSELLSYR